MSKGRELSDYIDDIITSTADAMAFTHGMSYKMFAADKKTINADKKTINAVIRCLEVLGEATKNIPTSFREKHPHPVPSPPRGTSNSHVSPRRRKTFAQRL